MKKIYVCSPLRGAVQRNIIRANLYSRFIYKKGHLPLAPHAIFTKFLCDEKKSERQAGMTLGMELLKLCDELWVFGLVHSEGATREADLPSGQSVAKAGSKLSLRPGQKNEIAEAKKMQIKIRYFNEEMEEQ